MLMDTNHINNLFLLGVDAYNSKSFYDAHEYWEDLWSDYKISDADFIQGLIQLAVACFHITNSNKKGATSLFNKSLVKLENNKSNTRISNLTDIIDSAVNARNFLESCDDICQFDWDIMIKIKASIV